MTVSQHRGWPNLSLPAPPPVNPIAQAAPNHSPVQSPHARKRLKNNATMPLIKENPLLSPPHPPMARFCRPGGIPPTSADHVTYHFCI